MDFRLGRNYALRGIFSSLFNELSTQLAMTPTSSGQETNRSAFHHVSLVNPLLLEGLLQSVIVFNATC